LVKEIKDLREIQAKSKTGRYFHRIKSGLLRSKILKHQVRLIDFTTSNKAFNKNISHSFDVMFKRMRRKDPKAQYWKVNVEMIDGRIHIHMLYDGKFITKQWLMHNWNEIHESYIVKISLVRDINKMTNYLVTQYLANQDAEKTYMSSSKNWIFPGAVAYWKSLCKQIKNNYHYNPIQNKYYKNRIEVPFSDILDKIISIWNNCIYAHSFKQTTLCDYG
jgi:hypothetical protein